jgi:hypothetical protein
MASTELAVIENKFKAPPIASLDQFTQITAVRALVLKITVITGWAVPHSDMMTILVDQFLKLILERYKWINAVEIEFAFRNHGTKIKDWGKEMNLSLITEVLDSYVTSTSEIVEYAHKTAPIASESHIWTDEDFDNDFRAKIQNYLGFRWEGKDQALWLDHWAEVLVKDGFIKNQENALDFINWCLENEIKTLYVRNQQSESL